MITKASHQLKQEIMWNLWLCWTWFYQTLMWLGPPLALGCGGQVSLDTAFHDSETGPWMHRHRNRRIHHHQMKTLTVEEHTWVSHFISNSETTCVSISFLRPFHCVAAVKWHRSRLFVENNTPHFRWMMVHIHPVAYDFLSLSAGSGLYSPGTRGPSICTTAQRKRSVWGHPRKQ